MSSLNGLTLDFLRRWKVLPLVWWLVDDGDHPVRQGKGVLRHWQHSQKLVHLAGRELFHGNRTPANMEQQQCSRGRCCEQPWLERFGHFWCSVPGLVAARERNRLGGWSCAQAEGLAGKQDNSGSLDPCREPPGEKDWPASSSGTSKPLKFSPEAPNADWTAQLLPGTNLMYEKHQNVT